MNDRIKRLRADWQRQERGFTLIELLVVIVILGVLAAVVVFAVQGTGDKGKLAAFRTDAKTLRTAEEAYCAQNGGYATEAELVSGGFLSAGSTLNEAVAFPTGGPCNGERYTIACDPNDSSCGQEGTVPDGGFVGGTGTTTTGAWKQTGSMPTGVTTTQGTMVTMPNGKVLMWGRVSASPPLTPGTWAPGPIQVYDPATGKWSSAPPVPGPAATPAWNPLTSAALAVLKGGPEECGSACGKVLVQALVASDEPPAYLNVRHYLFDPDSQVWTPVAEPSGFVLGSGASSRLIQIDCSRASNPGSDCGKVMMAGGADNRGPSATPPRPVNGITDVQVALWDPAVGPASAGAWTTTTSPVRAVTDGVRNGTTTVTSATANFTTADIGTALTSLTSGIPNGAIITAVSPPNQATISLPATSSGSGQTWFIGTYVFTSNLAPLPGGRVLASARSSSTYDPIAKTWTHTSNTPVSFTFTCPPSSTVSRHAIGAVGVQSDGRVLQVGSSLSCNVAGAGLPAGNSLIFDPAAPGNGAWALAPSFCPCSANAPSVVRLPSSYGNKILMVYGGALPARGVVASALFDGATWTPVASQFTPRKVRPDGTYGTTTPGDGPALTVLATGQVLMAGGTLCTPTVCAGPGTGPTTDTWIYTPPVS